MTGPPYDPDRIWRPRVRMLPYNPDHMTRVPAQAFAGRFVEMMRVSMRSHGVVRDATGRYDPSRRWVG